MKFNEKLKLLRNKKSYTQQQVADYLGISRSTYGGYEGAAQ